MKHRFVLWPGGTWTLLASVDPRLLPDGTILLDPHQPSPARRMRRLHHGTWSAMTEADVDALYDRLQPLPPGLLID